MPIRCTLCLLALAMLGLALLSCDEDDIRRDCSNDSCSCRAGASCDIACNTPPCNVSCEQDSTCYATCANGTCSCAAGASCDFDCKAPPCHVRCTSDHAQCDGTCANGSCVCGTNSSCQFTCQSGPCHTECPAGASCVVLCPNAGLAGTQNCDIVQCATGTPTICPDGRATTCNAPCPAVGDGGTFER